MNMRPTVSMVAGCAVTGVIALTMAGADHAREIWFGMLAPLLVAVITWELVERTYRRDPAKVTGLMAIAFGVKMLFFGLYVAVMLKGLALDGVAFAVSFTAYFLGLHVAEAVFLKRLFAGGAAGVQ